MTAADNKLCDIFLIFREKQMILMKYHALFFFFEKKSRIWNCRLLQIIGGALWVKTDG